MSMGIKAIHLQECANNWVVAWHIYSYARCTMPGRHGPKLVMYKIRVDMLPNPKGVVTQMRYVTWPKIDNLYRYIPYLHKSYPYNPGVGTNYKSIIHGYFIFRMHKHHNVKFRRRNISDRTIAALSETYFSVPTLKCSYGEHKN